MTITGPDMFIITAMIVIAAGVIREWLRTPHGPPTAPHNQLVLGKDVLMLRSDKTGIIFECRSDLAKDTHSGRVSIHYLNGTVGRGVVLYNNQLTNELKIRMTEYVENWHDAG